MLLASIVLPKRIEKRLKEESERTGVLEEGASVGDFIKNP